MTKGRDLKPHIGIFGRRNTGKSSFINSLVNQDIAIVSEQAGTTTDPVKKSIEIFGIGPAVIIDTAGIDDSGELGRKRIEKSYEALLTVDCAILMLSNNTFGQEELQLIEKFESLNTPYLIIHNKSDIEPLKLSTKNSIKKHSNNTILEFSTFTKAHLHSIINCLRNVIPETAFKAKSLFEGLIQSNDIVLLITPIDSEAPEGRMILPQQMAIRNALDHNAIAIVIKETELINFVKKAQFTPKLVVTDSQAFGFVKKTIPLAWELTSFSILFARFKGNFENYIKGTPQIDNLRNNDRVLILESCTHQLSCEDIGRFKLPNWLRTYTKKSLKIDHVSGLSKLEKPITEYALVIQCGGCVSTSKQLKNRLFPAIEAGVAVSNYGMSIAYMNGIFERAVAPFNIK